jgi:hypothetical protein
MSFKAEPFDESPPALRACGDFVALEALGHELIDEGGKPIAYHGACEAVFQCRFCGEVIRFRDVAWGLGMQPLWVLVEITDGQRALACDAGRRRHVQRMRLNHSRLLERWKRFRSTANDRRYFN